MVQNIGDGAGKIYVLPTLLSLIIEELKQLKMNLEMIFHILF
jgi:hypothetical protein